MHEQFGSAGQVWSWKSGASGFFWSLVYDSLHQRLCSEPHVHNCTLTVLSVTHLFHTAPWLKIPLRHISTTNPHTLQLRVTDALTHWARAAVIPSPCLSSSPSTALSALCLCPPGQLMLQECVMGLFPGYTVTFPSHLLVTEEIISRLGSTRLCRSCQ